MLWVLEKRVLLGGCSSRTPWSESRALSMSRSREPSSLFAYSLSRVWIRRVAMFHWKPSWSLKNSRKAASSLRSERENLGLDLGCSACGSRVAVVFSFLAAWAERQTWARRPSIWRRPFLILGPSKEARLSKETDKRFSMSWYCCVAGGGVVCCCCWWWLVVVVVVVVCGWQREGGVGVSLEGGREEDGMEVVTDSREKRNKSSVAGIVKESLGKPAEEVKRRARPTNKRKSRRLARLKGKREDGGMGRGKRSK